ncbi:hypothetical protein [Butyricicoccus pullicaecorum]|uniref:hypothetical protein n=1 Tax=Butyricicoccus pullicaecorum TaxID=501571 RepID=UPI0039905A2C
MIKVIDHAAFGSTEQKTADDRTGSMVFLDVREQFGQIAAVVVWYRFLHQTGDIAGIRRAFPQNLIGRNIGTLHARYGKSTVLDCKAVGMLHTGIEIGIFHVLAQLVNFV